MAEGGELKSFMVIMLVVSAFVICVSTFISDVDTHYNVTSSDAYIVDTNSVHYGNVTRITGDIQSDLNVAPTEETGEDNLLIAAWKMMKRVYESTKVMENVIDDIGRSLPLPAGVLPIFYTIVTIVIIFSIIGVVTRTKAP